MFLFPISTLVIVVLLYIVFRKAGVAFPLTRLFGILVMFSVLATACLGQNYNESLIPGHQDGISVSNYLAFFLLGDDQWSRVKFAAYFENAITTSLVLMVLYIAALIGESRRHSTRK